MGPVAPASFGRIDVHGHFLPGVDDGCAVALESIRCARALVEAGYSHAFCTPHIWRGLPNNTAANIRRWTAELQAHLTQVGVPLTLLPGGEWNLPMSWPALRELPTEQIVTYGLGGGHLLFDFWSETLPASIEPAVGHLRSLGIQPVLAHPERIAVFQRDDKALTAVEQMGVLLQLNTWCMTDPPAAPTRKKAEQWLKEGRYFCCGTDTHDFAGMRSRIDGLVVLGAMVGQAELDRLTRINPQTLIPPVVG
jgi:protein-tyrosine phosphatase